MQGIASIAIVRIAKVRIAIVRIACLEVGGGILYPMLLAEPKAGVDAVGVVCLVRVRIRGGG